VFGIGGGSLSWRIGSAGRAPLPLLLLTFVCTGLWMGAFAAHAQAEGCPNERLRGQDGYALKLPDCRAYEQVSPVDKNFTDAAGVPGSVQSAPSGEQVTFYSLAPFPSVLSAASIPTYLSSRGGGGWSTEGLAPSSNPSMAGGSGQGSTEGLTEDLAEALILVEPGLEAGMASGSYTYLRDSATSAFRLLGPGIVAFADATADDSHIIFESREQLLPSATPNVVNLYEWNESKPPGEDLSLAGVLPDGKAPIRGSFAGPGGPALGGGRGGATGKFYTQNTISADGSRVFFSDGGTGQIYMRESEIARTIPVSAGSEPAYWRAATADGSMIFYTEGENLWRFNLEKFEEYFNKKEKPESVALAEAREPLTSGAAGVLGTLGVSTENGSYAYFVATGVLADNENDNGEEAEPDKANLYKWHEGETTFIAQLSTEGLDPADWRDFLQNGELKGPAQGEKSSRVTPNGTTVLFTSQAQLTSYDNAKNDELYLYEALGDRLLCVSCNPAGVPATSEAYLASNLELSIQPGARAFLTRNLSENGSRVFFQTEEALMPQDTNEQTDVYEWEREGVGGADGCSRSSTSFSASSGGCLYLISTGESAGPSYFGDASADGSDVFFFTRQSLVGQDQDENYDLYDARVEGGIAAQNPSPPVGCTKEGCLDPIVSSPLFAAPSSTTFAGVGDLALAPKGDPKPLTRAQQLARALKACRKQSRKKRSSCDARARKRYGKRSKR
jgi:hypothetical protein